MFTSRRTRIQKRREMLPGLNSGTQGSTRDWDAGALQMAWDVEPYSPDLKSMARILVQGLRLSTEQPDSRRADPDLVFAGQTY